MSTMSIPSNVKLFGYLTIENEPRRRPIPAPTEAPMAAPILNLVRHSPIFYNLQQFSLKVFWCNLKLGWEKIFRFPPIHHLINKVQSQSTTEVIEDNGAQVFSEAPEELRWMRLVIYYMNETGGLLYGVRFWDRCLHTYKGPCSINHSGWHLYCCWWAALHAWRMLVCQSDIKLCIAAWHKNNVIVPIDWAGLIQYTIKGRAIRTQASSMPNSQSSWSCISLIFTACNFLSLKKG